MRPKVQPIRDGVTFLQFAPSSKLQLPFFASRLRARFPSPADDYIEKKIDFNRYLAAHPAATSRCA
jgi:DNA polymerase V